MADNVLLTGFFKPAWKTYMLMQWVIVLVVTIAGIPLLLLIPFIRLVINRQYAALSCEMTEKFLKVRKGILVKVEKNVPLEQITDLGIVEGPLMRLLGVKQLSVETAGQSTQGPLVKLIGIDEPETFRDEVLKQRDTIRKAVTSDGAGGAPTTAQNTQSEILATLLRIEKLLSPERER